MNGSLVNRLRIRICLAIAILFLIAGIMLNIAIGNSLHSEFDARLEQACISLGHLVETDGYVVESELTENEWPQFQREQNPEYFEIYDETGKTHESSSSLGNDSLPRLHVKSGQVKVENALLPNGSPGRICAVALIPPCDPDMNVPEPDDSDDEIEAYKVQRTGPAELAGQPVTIAIGRSTAPINRLLSRLRWAIALITLVAIVAGGFFANYVAKAGIAPLNETVSQLAKFDSENLAIRFDKQDCPPEIEPAIDELNDMLARIESSFERERHFSTNIAHELRTPLAGLRSVLEVALAKSRKPDDYAASIKQCVSICEQTEMVLENMLTLGRVESNRLPLHREHVDLHSVLQSVLGLFSGRTRSRILKIDLQLTGATRILTDEAKLRVILRNLIDNAISYSGTGTKISIVGAQLDDQYCISISNIANRTEIQPDKWFDRFWRDDVARSETGMHCGIGLSLSRSLAQLMGGDLSAFANGRRVTMSLVLNSTG